ncbi:MAG: hypothetical protein M9908_10730 [Phyllobacteriaceae bacterium]|nr:hypothetical protein [Phyllobacteriaceae bacterium]
MRKLELKTLGLLGPIRKTFPRFNHEWSQQAWIVPDQLASCLRSDVDREGEPETVSGWSLPKQVISFPQSEPVTIVLRNS